MLLERPQSESRLSERCTNTANERDQRQASRITLASHDDSSLGGQRHEAPAAGSLAKTPGQLQPSNKLRCSTIAKVPSAKSRLRQPVAVAALRNQADNQYQHREQNSKRDHDESAALDKRPQDMRPQQQQQQQHPTNLAKVSKNQHSAQRANNSQLKSNTLIPSKRAGVQQASALAAPSQPTTSAGHGDGVGSEHNQGDLTSPRNTAADSMQASLTMPVGSSSQGNTNQPIGRSRARPATSKSGK